MKKILVLLVGIAFFAMNAQTEPVSYYQKMKEMTKELDTSQFANYTLYDKVYPLARLRKFTQTAVDTSSSRHILQAAHEITMASNKNIQINDDFLELIADNLYYNDHVVPIAILNVDMGFIKTDALDETSPKLTVELDSNDKQVLRPVQGEQPFENQEVLVASPLIEGITQENGAVTFDFQEAYFSRTNNPIQNLEVSIDNSTYQIIQNGSLVNGQIQHSFTTEGNNYLHFTGNYNDGSTFTTYSVIDVDFPIDQYTSGAYSDEIWVRSDENFTPYEPSADVNIPAFDYPYDGEYIPGDERPALKYQAFYADGRAQLEKPIIILDGIDFNIPGDCDICDRDIIDIKRMLHYYDNGVDIKLVDFYNQNGYDVIIVDFPIYQIGTIRYYFDAYEDTDLNPDDYSDINLPAFRKGGADYIQRNAKAFEQFLREINAELANNGSNEQLVVVGPSMGGQTSRYALTEMEANGENHNVRLWVSHDSPQQGANIPVGVQYMAHFFGDNKSITLLQRPASRELLVSHYLNRTQNNNATLTVDKILGSDYFRDNYKAELQNLGYPQLSRNLAISNGTINGVSTGTPGNNIANILFWLHDFPSLPLGTGKVFYTSNIDTSLVFNFDRIGFSNSFQFTCVNENGIKGSYDTAPGCLKTVPVSKEIHDKPQIIGGILIIGIDGFIATNNGDNDVPFTFMATKSTLDFQGANERLDEPLCRYGDLVSAGLTPFDSYYAPEDINEWHNELTVANVEWLWDEIENNYVFGEHTSPDISNCNFPPPVLHITGVPFLCSGEQATYTTVENVPIQWSVDGLSIISQTDREITVSKNDDTSLARLYASTNVSTYQMAEKSIHCLPVFEVDNDDNNLQLVSPEDDLPLSDQSITDVQWQLTHGTGSFTFANDTEARVSSTDYYGEVTLTNPKGTTTKTFFGPDPDKCYILKKVADDKYQVIDRCNGYTPITTMPIKEIYDEFGNKIQDAPVVNDELDVSQSGQTGDIRIIRVVVNGENVSKIIVKD